MYQNIDSSGDVFKRVSCYSIKKSTVSYVLRLRCNTNICTFYDDFSWVFAWFTNADIFWWDFSFSICVFALSNYKTRYFSDTQTRVFMPLELKSGEGQIWKNISLFWPICFFLTRWRNYIPQNCSLRHQPERNFIYDHFHFLIVGKFFHNEFVQQRIELGCNCKKGTSFWSRPLKSKKSRNNGGLVAK